MKRLIPYLASAALLTAGLLAALVIAPAAKAYTVDQLPGLGYSVSVTHLGDGCSTWLAGYGAAAKTDLGNDCDAGFQARVDALVAATCPCAQTTTTAQTVPPATTTAPADTTTTAPASTDPVPPPPAPAPTTTTAACDVQCQIADLQSQIIALRGELTQLVRILQTWPDIDPGILSALMALAP